jgi:hypothetical protein
MLYREIIAVCSEIHTKHINTLCGQSVGLLNVKYNGGRRGSAHGMFIGLRAGESRVRSMASEQGTLLSTALRLVLQPLPQQPPVQWGREVGLVFRG